MTQIFGLNIWVLDLSTKAAQPSQDWRALNSLQEREEATEGREVIPGGRQVVPGKHYFVWTFFSVFGLQNVLVGWRGDLV